MCSKTLPLPTQFIKRAESITAAARKKVVSVVIPLSAYMLLLIHPCFANESSPFVVDGETGGEQTLPKLSTAKEYYIRALNESNNKDYANSIRDYTEAIRLNPHYGEALGNRGA